MHDVNNMHGMRGLHVMHVMQVLEHPETLVLCGDTPSKNRCHWC